MSVCEKTAGIANKRRLEELEGRQGRVGPIEGQECQATAFPQVRVAKRKRRRLVPRFPQPKKLMLVSSSHVGNMADELRF